MQTRFSPAQLAEPRLAEIDSILRKCVHCGFCTATCPSFVITRDELDSPRGRIYLMKEMFENDRPADPETTLHLDRCLTCLSCMTTCPSGVDYMHLIDHGRAHAHATAGRDRADRLLRGLLAAVLPHRGRARLALGAAMLVRPLAPLVARLPGIGPRLAAMLRLAPARPAVRLPSERAGVYPAAGVRRGRVILMQGCVQPVLRPEINAAAIRLLTRLGIEVVQVVGEGCCGALVQHMGAEAAARRQAARNLDLWWRETAAGGGAGIDAILITASGCGTSVKDYGHLFAGTPDADRARTLAAMARDISEYLAGLDLPAPAAPRTERIAYHSACSMQHGQKLRDEPRALLRRAGFQLSEPAESHICCGSAGVYNILQPEISGALKARKQANLAALRPDFIATGNIGCLTQLAEGAAAPLVHTVQLIDWAYGGPAPQN